MTAVNMLLLTPLMVHVSEGIRSLQLLPSSHALSMFQIFAVLSSLPAVFYYLAEQSCLYSFFPLNLNSNTLPFVLVPPILFM
jgi:hypothetical protein